MNDLFTVVDQAAKTRYEGQSLRDGYDIWLQLAIVHVAYMTDEDDMPITDMDCGGGATLFWDDEYGEHMELFDSSCGREGSCYDCTDDTDYWDCVAENDGVQTMTYDPAEDLCEGCDVMFKHHMPSDEHAFSGTMNYNFGK